MHYVRASPGHTIRLASLSKALAHGKHDGEGYILIFLPFYSSCDPNQPFVRPFTAGGKYNQVDSI